MPKILIVDDEPGIRRMLSSMLEDEGYEVVASGDGRKALELVDKEQPDVLITDLMLPGLDGEQLVKQLEGYIAERHLPVIIMSAAFRVLGMPAPPNVSAVLPKPFELDQLLSTFRRLLADQ
jgi:CheY-like chemotaxis protein